MSTPRFSRLAPAERREQILDAANALFAERGYDEVSIEDIASAAGVTRGLVHHYFGGRKEVYIGLLERLGTMREQQLPPPVGRSARARLADDVSRWLDWTEQNRSIWLGTIAHGEDIADPDVRRVVTDLVRRAVALLAARHADIADDSPRLRYALECWTGLNRAATRRWLRGEATREADARTARLDPRARAAHIRHPTQAKPAHSPSLRSQPSSSMPGSGDRPAETLELCADTSRPLTVRLNGTSTEYTTPATADYRFSSEAAVGLAVCRRYRVRPEELPSAALRQGPIRTGTTKWGLASSPPEA